MLCVSLHQKKKKKNTESEWPQVQELTYTKKHNGEVESQFLA